MSYFVYILQSLKDQKYYIGSSANVEARLKFHNSGLQRSTRNRAPFRLVLFEEFNSKEVALKRERLIKSWKGVVNLRSWLRGSSPAAIRRASPIVHHRPQLYRR
jgi:putative endonuclease